MSAVRSEAGRAADGSVTPTFWALQPHLRNHPLPFSRNLSNCARRGTRSVWGEWRDGNGDLLGLGTGWDGMGGDGEGATRVPCASTRAKE